jgi:methyl-accepting chemotaxis protein
MPFNRRKNAQKSSQVDTQTDTQTGVQKQAPTVVQTSVQTGTQTDVKIASPQKVKSWRAKSWRVKTRLLTIFVGILPVTVLGGLSFLVSTQRTTQTIGEQQESQAQTTSILLKQFLSERHQDLQLLSQALGQELASSPEWKEIQTQLKSSKAKQQKPKSTGDVRADLQIILEAAKQNYVNYDSLAVLDLQGNPILQTIGPSWGSQAKAAYFQAALTNKYSVMGSPELSPGEANTDGFIPWAAPIKDPKTGEVRAIVVAKMAIEKLHKQMHLNGPISNHGQRSSNDLNRQDIYLRDATGQIFLSTQPEQPHPRWMARLSQEATGPSVSQNLQWGLTIAGSPTQVQSEHAFAASQIHSIANQKVNWQIIHASDPQAIVEIQRSQALLILLASAGLAGLIATIVGLSARRMSNIFESELEILRKKELQDQQKQQRLIERAQWLRQIVESMRKSLQEKDILNATVTELRHALNTDRVIVYRFHNDWNGTIIAESVAIGWKKILGEVVQDPFQEGLIERYRNGRVRAMDDIQIANITRCHQDILEGFEIRASVVAPILRNGDLIGLLCAHQCSGPRNWEEEDIDLFRDLASQLGFVLEQASMLEYTEQARQEARQEADAKAAEQQRARELLQQRARELLQEVQPVSKGDLTVQARVTPDEVGTIANSYNTIIQSLRQLVSQVQATSTSVATTASNNEAAVAGLSQEAKNQMQSLKEALKNVEMMIEAIAGISKRAKHAESSVQIATQTLIAGDAAMDRTVSGMSAIRETVAETAKKVKRLGEASQKISRVVSLINGFAAQTNMLALNAAIEASKAGEDGQGFGVVAEKVRSLAQQSTTATAEIEQLVVEIQSQTNEVVAAMETGTDQVVMGTHLVEESRQHLSQISEAGHHINQLVKEIVQVTITQTKTSQVVSHKMQQVASIADNTSQQTETLATSFTQLLKMADELQVSAAQFKVK